ncbi:uncharacterized protein BCR38DRAFT_484123 [Pseudomassariella vexata]|uniref:Uncharacterized protein n=1 Tax=Pseudomassariella vexata TaxID=1141098 RepID=A0A1Y2E5E4_9PEZI|nr:uncharacterized protein BCR38DRAFT_484123 [Pseudomassariella vexata]ORY66506.1 hypothetical protein BCR38DRAFT_484123 [Pseudomassariella vexata]
MSGPQQASAAAASSNGPSVSDPTAPSSSSAVPSGHDGIAQNGVSHSMSGTPDAVTHPGLRMATSNAAHRDGRVRNPIPSKLKGKTDENKGNFNVMHMDISHVAESQARYDAAKRNSESVALQAKMAETDHYVSHHRRANYQRPRPLGRSQVAAAAAAAVAAGRDSPEPQQDPPPIPRSRIPLTAEEAKMEQARLLTLLRGLNPLDVVNQICKALAYFGGVPEAPPPPDGNFPESAEANGSGSLFVGWIAEIFPDLDRPRPRPAPVLRLADPPKRPRGRPKGSKASKIRRDKGIKKGSKAHGQGAAAADRGEDDQHGPEESWVDVDDTMMEVDEDGDAADAVERRVLILLNKTPPRTTDSGAANVTPATGSTTGFTSINNTIAEASSASKRRGRPKGSKNKPKDSRSRQIPQQTQAPPIANSVQSPAPAPVMETPAPSAADGQAKKKTNAGRPKGSKNRSKGAADGLTPQTSVATPQLPAGTQPPTSTSYIPPPTFQSNTVNPSQSSAASGTASAKNRRTQLPAQSAPPVNPVLNQSTTTPQVKESSVVGAKRKRQSNKVAGPLSNGDGLASSAAATSSAQQLPTASPMINPSPVVTQANESENSWDANGTAAPAAKRTRKSNSTVSKRQSIVGNDGPAAGGSSEPTELSSPTSATTQNHTAADGLDAHLERFTAMAQSNRNHMYGNRPPVTNSTSQIASSAPPAEGLRAHYEHFAHLQNTQQNTNQNNSARQHQQQQTGQIASPTPLQLSKSSTLSSQQQQRPTSNYYTQNQASSYTAQQGSAYHTNQRMSSGSPATTLVSHVAHSPQFGAQSSNSPLMGTDTSSFRGSPLQGIPGHTNQSFAPRRTPSASPMDNANYRQAGNVSTQSPHFGSNNTRQPANSSHAGVASGFPSFSDPSFLDIDGLGNSASGHGGMGLNNTGYNLGSTGTTQRSGSSNTGVGSTYGTTAMNRGYRGQNQWS